MWNFLTNNKNKIDNNINESNTNSIIKIKKRSNFSQLIISKWENLFGKSATINTTDSPIRFSHSATKIIKVEAKSSSSLSSSSLSVNNDKGNNNKLECNDKYRSKSKTPTTPILRSKSFGYKIDKYNNNSGDDDNNDNDDNDSDGYNRKKSISSTTKLNKNSKLKLSSPLPTKKLLTTEILISTKNKIICCDKCDSKQHDTDNCPHYKKSRDVHPDAQKNFYEKLGGKSSLPNSIIRNAKVIRQPGDGSCLFHSMSYGLSDKSNANLLRSQICQFITNNPNFKICETPLSDWVKWDSNVTTSEYARKMSRGAWGGGIEMAVLSRLRTCNVHVYEKTYTGYKRISAFDYPDSPENKKIVRVVYQGSCHYDALVI